MKIGIDISQLAYEKTGVANYLTNLVQYLLKIDRENEYILFFSSLRRKIHNLKFIQEQSIQNYNPKLKIKNFKFPPLLLDFIWNKLHIFPVEWFIGDIDVFISSDWTEPPCRKAKKATILYDLIVYKYPEETDKKIVDTQRRKINWVRKECNLIFCISETTKKDAMDVLNIEERKLKVIYPSV